MWPNCEQHKMFNVCKSHAILFDLLHKMFLQQQSKVLIRNIYPGNFIRTSSNYGLPLSETHSLDSVCETRVIWSWLLKIPPFFYVCDMLMKMLNFGQSFVNNQKRKFAWLGPLLPCGWPRLDRVALTKFGQEHFGVFSMILHDLRYQHGAPNSVHDKKVSLYQRWAPTGLHD